MSFSYMKREDTLNENVLVFFFCIFLGEISIESFSRGIWWDLRAQNRYVFGEICWSFLREFLVSFYYGAFLFIYFPGKARLH